MSRRSCRSWARCMICLPAAWNDPKFHGPTEVKRQEVTLTGQVVGTSGARPVPDLPREGFLATYYYIANRVKDRKIPQLGLMLPTMGIRRNEVRDCDAEGHYQFEGLPRLRADKQEGTALLQNDMQTLAVIAYRIDPQTGAITATTDLGKQAADSPWSIDFKLDVTPIRSVVFNCEEFALTGLYDPRYLQSLGEIIPLDARRNAEPQRYSMMLGDEMLAGFVEPGTRSDLLIRYGRIGNRLVLLNSQQNGDAKGYTAQELNRSGPLSLATSGDFLSAGRSTIDRLSASGRLQRTGRWIARSGASATAHRKRPSPKTTACRWCAIPPAPGRTKRASMTPRRTWPVTSSAPRSSC